MYWNKKIYQIGLKDKDYSSKLKKLIKEERANTIKNHFWNRDKDEDGKIVGAIKENSFVLWRINTFGNGISYPIFKGKFSKVRDTSILNLSIRFNPLVEILVILYSLFWFFFITFGLVLVGEVAWYNLSIRTFFGLLLFFILQSPSIIVFYTLRRQTLPNLEKYLNLKEVRLKRKK